MNTFLVGLPDASVVAPPAALFAFVPVAELFLSLFVVDLSTGTGGGGTSNKGAAGIYGFTAGKFIPAVSDSFTRNAVSGTVTLHSGAKVWLLPEFS